MGGRTFTFRRGIITHDLAGLNQLVQCYKEVVLSPETTVTVDMSALKRFDAHLTAALSVIVDHALLKKKSIRFDPEKMPDKLRESLNRSGFLAEWTADRFNTNIPLQRFKESEGVLFSSFAKKHLSRPEVPKMTDYLRGRFFEGIDEIFANASLHSKSKMPICVSGQFFPTANRLNFTIADGGIGMQATILRARNEHLPADEAIDWAMTANNTTRQGDIPGGLGSQILRDFVAANRGKLVVVSRGGVWMQIGSAVQKSRLPGSFPGTFVVLEIDTSDNKSYDLVAAPDPRDIW